MKVPTRNMRHPDRNITESMAIYEVEKLALLMRIHRAEALLQMSLHNDTVLFEFPILALTAKEDTFIRLHDDIGPVLGAQIITTPQGRANGKFMVEARFATDEATVKALTHGITVDEVQY